MLLIFCEKSVKYGYAGLYLIEIFCIKVYMYKENSYVVYPMYGICKVVDIGESRVGDHVIECYILHCESENITVKVPVSRVDDYRIREIISGDEAKSFLELLQCKPEDIENNWKVRSQMNEEKLKNGEIRDTIEVARTLFTRNQLKELSASEKRLYEKAYLFIVHELSIALNKDQDEIEDIVSSALEKSAKKFRGKTSDKKTVSSKEKDDF